jgi:hypothetical protein
MVKILPLAGTDRLTGLITDRLSGFVNMLSWR